MYNNGIYTDDVYWSQVRLIPFCKVPALSINRRMFCSNGFDTMRVACTDLLCVVCIGLLSAEFSTVNTGLGRPML